MNYLISRILELSTIIIKKVKLAEFNTKFDTSLKNQCHIIR